MNILLNTNNKQLDQLFSQLLRAMQRQASINNL